MKKNYLNSCLIKKFVNAFFVLIVSYASTAQVVLENEIKITDFGLHFGGSKVAANATNTGDSTPYDFYFGPQISAHGDCIKTYTDANGIEYVFMTWYRGGKDDRHVMLTRYNTSSGSMATIEFPHRHTGYLNQWWIGESHNTIGIGISPLDGTIHLLYDMHAYSGSRPSNGSFSDDYFRYSYSIANAASLPDADFTLDKFVKNSNDSYKHLRLTGNILQSEFVGLTYPQYFLNDSGDLFMYMRMGGNNNGAYKFTKYDASTSTWSNFTDFNALNASNQSGVTYNWGLYGNMKYVNGKIRVGFQKRSANNNDKYEYQNGVYYAYSDDQEGKTGWKNHKGESFSLPLYDAEFAKVMEPGDYVTTTQANKVYIVSDFDWTVTDAGDVHIISKVRDAQYNITKNLHTYKPAGATDFITSENFSGGSSVYTAGEDVFIIGLSGKKVYVDKAAGGTNNFTRVYESTDVKNFTHGIAHIDNGKLYYYLMQEKSGNARPLYLQVIDLDIEITNPVGPNNFTIQTFGETCPGKANGRVVINGAATHDYVATINGVAYDFIKDKTIENLPPGTYDLCVDVVGKDYSHCYQVTIEEAPNLAGKISISKQSAIVSVQSGAAPYTVIKNGLQILETYQSNFSIDVNHGDNIQIKSKEACQGEMLKTIDLLENIKAYPNPTSGLFELYIPNNIETITLEVYNIQSQLLVSKTTSVNAGKVQLNLEDKPKGVYFVKVNSKKPVFIKVIKQ